MTALDRRFVQLPIDHERLPAASADAITYLPACELPTHTPATLIGALGALLQRFTQQELISLDVERTAGNKQALDLSLPAGTTIGQATAQAQTRSANGSETVAQNPANILLSFSTAEPGAQLPAHYELHFVFQETPALRLQVGYRRSLFAAATIERLVDSYLTLLTVLPAQAAASIDSLPILSAAQLIALTSGQDSGTATYPQQPVHRLFENLAQQQPNAVVAVSQGRQLTYGELNERSNRLAHLLIGAGVGAEIPVAVCIRPSVDILVALLAVFKAGGVYLPLDPGHPETLIKLMLDEAQPRMVLTHSNVPDSLWPAQFKRFHLDTDWQQLAAQPATTPAVNTDLGHAAYLLYTSGTTGKPKGVLATHGNLAHYIHVAQQRYRFQADDVFCSLARYTFSISLFDLVSPLCLGGSVRILDRDEILALDKLCAALQTVTVLHAGPSLMSSLFRYLRATPDTPQTFPAMRHASAGGDLVPAAVMEDMKPVFPNAELFVIYGCTEVSCMGTTFEISRTQKIERSFVGKPFTDTTLRVLDEQRQLVPFGVVGEICFAGKGITRGYLDRPELTAEKFVELDGQRFYRTGDLGRLHADGQLEMLGRRDFQVQLRGMRIELAGIENMVRDLKLAAQCTVVMKTMNADDQRLVAFVVGPTDSVIAIRRSLAAHLPDYMVPQHVIALESLPVTTNGKLDRNRLIQMPLEAQLGSAEHAAPETPAEQEIATVFSRVLGVGSVGVDDNFFELGGHSLLAVVALQDIGERLGVELAPHVMFESATVRTLAAHAATASGSSETRPILLNEPGDGAKLFMLSGIHIYRELAKRLNGKHPAYGVFTDSEFSLYAPERGSYSVPQLAQEYIEIIRREQRSGPYHLLGFSFAGIVAYEVAQQLVAAGEEVRYLALVDAVLPEWILGWRFRMAQLGRIFSTSPTAIYEYLQYRSRSKHGAEANEAETHLIYGVDPYKRPQDEEMVNPLESVRSDVNHQTAANYLSNIRPYSGHVALLVSGERLRRDPLKSPSGGWAPHLPNHQIYRVEADHLQMLNKDPYALETARFIVEGIQRASRR
ncbi:MAG: amino acid adenylation domain-containing protein [Steroidobacteraceae bacterium]